MKKLTNKIFTLVLVSSLIAFLLFIYSNAQTTLDTPVISLEARETSVIVSWSSVPEATNYNIQYKENSSSSWTDIQVDNVLEYEVENLESNTNYDFQVKATKGVGSEFVEYIKETGKEARKHFSLITSTSYAEKFEKTDANDRAVLNTDKNLFDSEEEFRIICEKGTTDTVLDESLIIRVLPEAFRES